ncbi:MAG: hypothetical protein IPO00_03180 [Betaproteobacteria bacterium]|nr:hypothetical protein [Betaproteobacteria bacterium]
MDQAMKILPSGGGASTILLTFLLLVLAADALSPLPPSAGGRGRHCIGGRKNFGVSACAIARLVLLWQW